MNRLEKETKIWKNKKKSYKISLLPVYAFKMGLPILKVVAAMLDTIHKISETTASSFYFKRTVISSIFSDF